MASRHTPKMTPMRYPYSQELRYRRELLGMNREMRALLNKELRPLVPAMVEDALQTDLPTGPIVQDAFAWADMLTDALSRILVRMLGPVAEVIRALNPIGSEVAKLNKEEWRKLVRSQYGVSPTSEDPNRYQRLLDRWSEDNAALIKNIPTQTARQIAQMTREALVNGRNVKDTTAEVLRIMGNRVDVSDSRARLIARDQVAKLNGNLTQSRQNDAGVESYVWRTVGDERVRDTHRVVDGKQFTWDRPPAETGGNHPGGDFQCRCWAEPVLPERMAFEAMLKEAA